MYDFIVSCVILKCCNIISINILIFFNFDCDVVVCVVCVSLVDLNVEEMLNILKYVNWVCNI